MKYLLLLLSLTLFLVLLNSQAHGQVEERDSVYLKDGNVVVGQITTYAVGDYVEILVGSSSYLTFQFADIEAVIFGNRKRQGGNIPPPNPNPKVGQAPQQPAQPTGPSQPSRSTIGLRPSVDYDTVFQQYKFFGELRAGFAISLAQDFRLPSAALDIGVNLGGFVDRNHKLGAYLGLLTYQDWTINPLGIGYSGLIGSGRTRLQVYLDLAYPVTVERDNFNDFADVRGQFYASGRIGITSISRNGNMTDTFFIGYSWYRFSADVQEQNGPVIINAGQQGESIVSITFGYALSIF